MTKEKENKIKKMIADGEYKSVKVAARISPALYLEVINKGDVLGIDNESTLIKIALKDWVRK